MAGRISRCPFLSHTSINQIKKCSDDLLENIAKRCPVASECVGQKMERCPFQHVVDRKIEKEIKMIANKCHDWTQTKSTSPIPLMFEAEDALKKKREEKTYRIWSQVERNINGPESKVNGEFLVNWSSNDYLGLSNHPEVTAAALSEINACGVGSGGSRNISGTHSQHVQLEYNLANWHGHEAGLLFTSCYAANDAVLNQLGVLAKQNNKQLVFISDEKNHASMIEGIRKAEKMNSGFVTKRVFRHNDLNHLEEILAEYDNETIKLVAFESVYSMDGDHAPIADIANLAHFYNALTFCDEVHAVGLYGENGQGLVEEHLGIDMITGTLGKSLGSMGGYVTSSKSFIEYFRLHCPGLIYTTSLAPSLAAAANKSIEISYSEEGFQLRMKHKKNVEMTKLALLRYFPEMEDIFEKSGHIVPIFIEGSEVVKLAQKELQSRGHYCQAVFAPTVKKGTERLRLVVTPHHTKEQIFKLVNDLAEVVGRTDDGKFFQMF